MNLKPAESNGKSRAPLRVPFTIPRAQVYYWRYEWQAGERQSLVDLEAGDYAEFDSDDATDVSRWLADDDD